MATDAEVSAVSAQIPANVAGKNAVINGGFDIWQRGTSSTSTGYVTADRWVSQSSGGTTTFAREATIVPSTSQYAMKWTQTTSAAYANIIQAIETSNAIQFAGKTVTLSALVAASVNQGVALELYYATTVDKTIAGAGWIQLTPDSGGSASPSSTTYIPASGVFSVPSNAKSLMVGITTISIPVGTTFYVDQVQLELGSSPTSFSRAGGDIQGELAKCQRYYQVSTGITYIPFSFSSVYRYSVQFPVSMRVAPTVSVTGYAGGGGQIVGEFISTSSFQTGANNPTSGPYFTQYTASAEL
jgi:hypothetical protein